MVKKIQRMKQSAAVAEPIATQPDKPEEVLLLREIRDQLQHR